MINILRISLFLSFIIQAPDFFSQEHFDTPMSTTGQAGDSVRTVKDLFNASSWRFHSRTFFMNTLNQGSLKDDYALAQGAGIGLITKPWKGIQLGLSGYFIFNVWSSNLGEKDPQTQASNRYEIGQFDVLDRSNRHNLDRLEDLYFRYSKNQFTLTLGRMTLETPFVNMQDGRMRPTLEEGIWLSQNSKSDSWKFQGGVIWGISPRSTVDWFKLRESIGPYGSGVNIEGDKIPVVIEDKANMLFLVNPEVQVSSNWRLKYWNTFFQNVMNTSLLESNLTWKLAENEMFFNAMWIHQNAIGNGGNANTGLTYIQKGATSNVVSVQLGSKSVSSNFNLNYTHIMDGDRYLMPREWGRDPFYTFMSRERNEGMANVNAFTAQFSQKTKTGIRLGMGAGYYRLPSVTNYRQNKYGMPSYGQINAFASYKCKGTWEGLEVRFLVAAKTAMTHEVLSPKNEINKVNMINSNLVLDFNL